MNDGRSLFMQIAETKGYIQEDVAFHCHWDVSILLQAFSEGEWHVLHDEHGDVGA